MPFRENVRAIGALPAGIFPIMASVVYPFLRARFRSITVTDWPDSSLTKSSLSLRVMLAQILPVARPSLNDPRTGSATPPINRGTSIKIVAFVAAATNNLRSCVSVMPVGADFRGTTRESWIIPRDRFRTAMPAPVPPLPVRDTNIQQPSRVGVTANGDEGRGIVKDGEAAAASHSLGRACAASVSAIASAPASARCRSH